MEIRLAKKPGAPMSLDRHFMQSNPNSNEGLLSSSQKKYGRRKRRVEVQEVGTPSDEPKELKYTPPTELNQNYLQPDNAKEMQFEDRQTTPRFQEEQSNDIVDNRPPPGVEYEGLS